MRVVIQRVNHAAVRIDGETVGQIQKGLLLLVGLAEGDGEEQVVKAADKIAKMRIFEDEAGKTNLFTLLADTKRGNRPSFVHAMRPPKSSQLWEEFNQELVKRGLTVETGEFGADMKVELENDGPFTIVLDL